MPLPSDLYEVFGLDEGMRPGVCFENLEAEEVVRIYKHIKDHIGPTSSETKAWSNTLETDVEIASLDNPARQVVSGELDSFRHYLPDYQFGDIAVSSVSVYVFPRSLELFYDVRDIGSKTEVENILALIKTINTMCPSCTPFFAEEDGTPREEPYQKLLRCYLNA
ncbi:hypothetical protein MIB92_12575 [Aestuariirhabdus sp. Z084]|uniref:hypothetical protein n=1 Tax=Aestuariirhabdus haliotis TaxID=2918751 RepID=UPI00201B3A9D|nr:hypothetical protein [Aestuariirhabdus haliotis]MCL6416490.1 hypothetical protein [Aestuariirhabdus haliotis]MCL6420480.1 hypothetical protein [Aestuariirhabdus haliotis]